MRKVIGGGFAMLLSIAAACAPDSTGDLRQDYERMLARTADRSTVPVDTPQAVAAAPQPDLGTPEVLDPALDTLPAAIPPAQQPVPQQPVPEPPAPQQPVEAAPGIQQRPAPAISPAILRGVRVGPHDTFDRIVFEFDGNQLPGYHIEYIDRPVRECGSGNVVQVAGDGWLRVRLQPARAHEFVGERAEVTVRDRNRSINLPVVRQLTLICDFEAQVEWVLGVTSPNRYRTMILQDPTRLVVDVMH